MRYPPTILEEIRARLPISGVVGKRVRLRKAGREWKGLSPFNAEKTPSFYVNDQKQFYHCFSSGKHGDVFTFLMETEGLSFPEAVERLAGEAGVALPKLSREDVQQETRRRSLYDVMDMAAVFFEASLQGRFGAKARDYLTGRALSRDTQARFRVGYAPPERYALRDHLADKGVSLEVMGELGLLVTGEDVKVPFDRFRDRVMFPICDVRGRVIAFGGRAMSADVPAKYLNSPDTPLFNKGRLLYNYHLARGPAHDKGTVLAVEGYVDVISLSAAGFPNAVAPLGTALTEDQLTLLWRLCDEPILCFDGDKAGQRAAYRALETALPNLTVGKSLRFAMLPDGQDPDDLARAGGASAIERVLAGARPLVDMLWAREMEAGPVDTPERKAMMDRRLRESLGVIRDETLKRYYREEVEARLSSLSPDTRPARFQRGGGGGRRDWRGPTPTVPSARLSVSPLLARSALFTGGGADSPREAMILGTFLRHPELLHDHAETLAELEFEGRGSQMLCRMLLDGAASGDPAGVEVMQARVERAGLTEITDRMMSVVRPGDRWMLDPHADLLRLEDALRQAITLHRRSRTLHSELRAAERALAEEDNEANLAWLREVQTQLSSVEGAEADPDGGSVHRNH
ncbi:DNA primase [Microvirga pudoricolor]|uniref:DNA primase n=1 Tax=Microvirga pudoricolor TaxID=2778729 RepID=UPI001951BCBA|nr:DNA primase [Microvirga pudoricolor]MBM6592435.1 DNA primase [Microvirga pudoricolor]